MKTLKLLAPELNDNQLKMIERELMEIFKDEEPMAGDRSDYYYDMLDHDNEQLEYYRKLIRKFIGVE